MKQYFYENMEAVPIDLCEQLKKDFETLEWMPALLNNQTYHEKRNCFINDTAMQVQSGCKIESINSLRVIMNTYLKSVNKSIYKGVDTPDDFADIQVIKYSASDAPEGTCPHFDWHTDDVWTQPTLNLIRKLTQVVVISDGDKDFEGGKVEFDPLHGELEYDGRKQGSMIMFPSFLKHRVNNVTRGIRYAVNGWSYGPSWR
jgi:predicted 2-oxoglutarate/Fe(II)-dependent dioxygenase YbiX